MLLYMVCPQLYFFIVFVLASRCNPHVEKADGTLLSETQRPRLYNKTYRFQGARVQIPSR